MKRVINKKAYNTETAERIATNDFSNGNDKFNLGRTESLYRTKKGSYFEVNYTVWEGESNSLTPLSKDEAEVVYEKMFDRIIEFELAFPDMEVEEV